MVSIFGLPLSCRGWVGLPQLFWVGSKGSNNVGSGASAVNGVPCFGVSTLGVRIRREILFFFWGGEVRPGQSNRIETSQTPFLELKWSLGKGHTARESQFKQDRPRCHKCAASVWPFDFFAMGDKSFANQKLEPEQTRAVCGLGLSAKVVQSEHLPRAVELLHI